jgi:hypothetical protein
MLTGVSSLICAGQRRNSKHFAAVEALECHHSLLMQGKSEMTLR